MAKARAWFDNSRYGAIPVVGIAESHGSGGSTMGKWPKTFGTFFGFFLQPFQHNSCDKSRL